MNKRLTLTLVIAGAVGAIALMPGVAGAYTANCSTTDEGSTGAFSAGFRENNVVILASADDGRTISGQEKGTKKGSSIAGAFGCGTASGPKVNGYGVYLGDEDDIARADGKGYDLVDGLGPVDRVADLILRGGGGDDKLVGHDGGGLIRGGSGDDIIRDTGGNDTIGGGGGDDTIYAKDGARDEIDCGAGDDVVRADPIDSLHSCR